MPIFTYFAVVGAALLGLLFYADANLAPRGPLAVTTDFAGLPPPWHGPVNPSLAAAPAPAPDMKSETVLAATPKPATNGKVAAATIATNGIGTSDQTPRAERAPKKKKQIVVRRAPQWHEQPPRYAWRGDSGPFGGGGGMFGRF